MREGVITKGVGGFYYVAENGELHVCRAAGVLRTKKIKPAVGDRVLFEDEDHGDMYITDILPRENYIKRPPAANVDQIVLVFAVKEPAADYLLLDKLLIDGSMKGIPTLLCVTKCDLAEDEDISFIKNNYASAAEDIVFTSSVNGSGLSELRERLEGKLSLLRGVSGAGKTSLLNALCPQIERETGELSRKLKRGKNTTRHSELLMADPDSFILDTPGFSDFEPDEMEANDLWKYYPEFYEYSVCRYMNCVHINEPECGIKTAVEEGGISRLRYDNYRKLYDVLKKNRRWQ